MIIIIFHAASTATAITSAMHLTCYNDTDKVSGNISVEAVWSIQGTQEVIDAIGEYSIRSTLVDTATGVPTIQDIIVDSTIPANKVSVIRGRVIGHYC